MTAHWRAPLVAAAHRAGTERSLPGGQRSYFPHGSITYGSATGQTAVVITG